MSKSMENIAQVYMEELMKAQKGRYHLPTLIVKAFLDGHRFNSFVQQRDLDRFTDEAVKERALDSKHKMQEV